MAQQALTPRKRGPYTASRKEDYGVVRDKLADEEMRLRQRASEITDQSLESYVAC